MKSINEEKQYSKKHFPYGERNIPTPSVRTYKSKELFLDLFLTY